METNNVKIDYIVHESAMARNERTIKALIKALVLSIVALLISNAIWLWAWMQYDYVGGELDLSTVTVDAKEGIANYIGQNGDIQNGEDPSDEG